VEDNSGIKVVKRKYVRIKQCGNHGYLWNIHQKVLVNQKWKLNLDFVVGIIRVYKMLSPTNLTVYKLQISVISYGLWKSTFLQVSVQSSAVFALTVLVPLR